MGRIAVVASLSLDGVAQAPGLPDEDRSGGFAHGGWHMAYLDDLARSWALENLTRTDAFLLGRRTYETFAAYWPDASEEEHVVARPLTTKPKYVASTTLREPLPWHNSSLLAGDVAEAVGELRARHGEVQIIGSTTLVRWLLERGLVDELRLMVDPLVLGGGKSIFPHDGARRPFRLIDSQVTTTGSILARYVAGAG